MASRRAVRPHPNEAAPDARVEEVRGPECRCFLTSSSHLLPTQLEAELRQLEEKRIADWLREFGAAGFIQDLDGDGSQTPAEIFDAADKRLNSLVSLGVMAGLLAGTAITTLDFADETLLGDTAYSFAFISSACSLSVAMLVSYHYFNGAKLMSLGHLTVEFFGVRTESFKVTCVRCFFVGSVTQLLALALLAIGKLHPQARHSLLECIPLLVAIGVVVALAIWISTAMVQDRAACSLRVSSVIIIIIIIIIIFFFIECSLSLYSTLPLSLYQIKYRFALQSPCRQPPRLVAARRFRGCDVHRARKRRASGSSEISSQREGRRRGVLTIDGGGAVVAKE